PTPAPRPPPFPSTTLFRSGEPLGDDLDLDQCHGGDDKAAPGAGAQHAQILPAVAGDIVFALMAGILGDAAGDDPAVLPPQHRQADRKSTRLNSSHVKISYA